MPNNMHNMPNDNMQNNMQINMQNMLAICRIGADCLVLTVISKPRSYYTLLFQVK